MAYTQPHIIRFTDSDTIDLEFLHEIVETPMGGESYLFMHADGFHQPHEQDYCELIFFQSGSRDIRIGKTESIYTAGDIMVVTPQEEHCGRSHHCILDRYYLHIYPQAFSHLKDGGRTIMGIFYNRELYTNNKITLPYEVRARVQKLLTLVDNTLRFGNSSTREIEAYALVIEILGILNPYANGAKQARTAKGKFLLNVLSYIENAYPETDVLKNAMRSFGISRSSLWRMFKSELNTTPGAYLLNIRLANAKLLLDAGYDVTNTAAECGFSDCSHFIKKFKERYSLTPLAYKNRTKKFTAKP